MRPSAPNKCNGKTELDSGPRHVLHSGVSRGSSRRCRAQVQPAEDLEAAVGEARAAHAALQQKTAALEEDSTAAVARGRDTTRRSRAMVSSGDPSQSASRNAVLPRCVQNSWSGSAPPSPLDELNAARAAARMPDAFASAPAIISWTASVFFAACSPRARIEEAEGEEAV